MGAIHRITKNTILLAASNIIGKIITFFYVVIAARYLGVNNFGALSFALAFTSIFAILADLGLSRMQIREIARDKSCVGKITINIMFLKFFLGIVNLLLMALIINILHYPLDVVLSVYIIGLSVVLTNFQASFESVFQGFEKMEYMAIAHILNSLALFLGAIFIINRGGGITQFALVYLISSIIIVAFELLVIIKKFTLVYKKIDFEFCKCLLKESFPFALSSMFVVIYLRFDSILLSIFKGETAVGLYSASYKLVDSLSTIYYSFMIALFPVTSRLFKYSKEKLMFSFEKSIKYLLMVSIPIAVGTTLLSNKIIEFIYTATYAPSVIVLQILVWSAVLVFINTVLSNLLDSTNKQTIVAKQNAMAAVINFLINLILIPSYSYIGAGIATIATQIFSLFYLSLYISKTEFKLPRKALSILLSKIAFASFLMGILVIIPISALFYFSLFYLFGGIDREDIEIAKKLFGGFLNLR